MGCVGTVGKNEKKLLRFQRKTDTCGRGAVVRDNAYKDVIFMCLFRQLVDFET